MNIETYNELIEKQELIKAKKVRLVAGKNVSYLDIGNPNDPVVVMLHGVPESSLLWSEIIPTIVSLGYRAIAPDLPGFGQSERFKEPATWERYEQFLHDFLEASHIGDFHLIVHDWGGLIGLKWACDQPEKVKSLVVTDTTFSSDYTWHKVAQKWRTLGTGERLIKRMANKEVWSAGMRQEIPHVTDMVLDDFFQVFTSKESRKVILDLYRSGDMEKVVVHEGKLNAIDRPVTIIWGEDDPYIPPEFAYKLRDQEFPHADVYMIEKAGHFIHLEYPGIVNEQIKNHFKKVDD